MGRSKYINFEHKHLISRFFLLDMIWYDMSGTRNSFIHLTVEETHTHTFNRTHFSSYLTRKHIILTFLCTYLSACKCDFRVYACHLLPFHFTRKHACTHHFHTMSHFISLACTSSTHREKHTHTHTYSTYNIYNSMYLFGQPNLTDDCDYKW